MPDLLNYIGCKQLQAGPMTLGEYNSYRGWQIPTDENPARPGYLVVYPDGYQSWSPAEVFESAYMNMQSEDVTRCNWQMIFDLIHRSTLTVTRLGAKTTCVTVTLPNGHEIVETSACVDPANYNEAIGKEVAMVKIHQKLWELLGFTLACARNGM